MGKRCLRHGAKALCLTFVYATVVYATAMPAAAEGDVFEEHHAHEHGVATLEVAIESAQLAIQFRSPAMNLLGFEHRPRSVQDQAALSRALGWLRDPAGQFQPSNDAGCRVVKSEVTPPDWEHSAEHSEFAANYEFDCDRPAALRQLEVRLLQHLDSGVKIEVQVASPEGQRRVELTRSNPRLSLRSRSK
jgi:hypothetical protein